MKDNSLSNCGETEFKIQEWIKWLQRSQTLRFKSSIDGIGTEPSTNANLFLAPRACFIE